MSSDRKHAAAWVGIAKLFLQIMAVFLYAFAAVFMLVTSGAIGYYYNAWIGIGQFILGLSLLVGGGMYLMYVGHKAHRKAKGGKS